MQAGRLTSAPLGFLLPTHLLLLHMSLCEVMVTLPLSLSYDCLLTKFSLNNPGSLLIPNISRFGPLSLVDRIRQLIGLLLPGDESLPVTDSTDRQNDRKGGGGAGPAQPSIGKGREGRVQKAVLSSATEQTKAFQEHSFH